MFNKTLASAIASHSTALENAKASNNSIWVDKHEDCISQLVRDFLPSGSGFDAGVELESANDSKLTFKTSFHHLNENGFYDGWTEHKVSVSATFSGLDIKVSGRNRNEIKDYIAETFEIALTRIVTFDANNGRYIFVK